jgi:hypothetical protein
MDIYKCPISEIGGRELNFLYIIHFGGGRILYALKKEKYLPCLPVSYRVIVLYCLVLA